MTYLDLIRSAEYKLDKGYITLGRYEEMIEPLKREIQPEREQGKWVKISPANIYECSKCGKNVMTDDINEYDFCHGCGADMRGGDIE